MDILRVGLYPSRSKSRIGRALNYLSFAVSAAVVGTVLVRDADVAYVYHPPPTVAVPALFLRLFRGIPFVYDVLDLWPDTLQATGMLESSMVLRAIGFYCKFVYHFAARIVVPTEGFRERLIKRGVHAERVSVIYNWSGDIGGQVQPVSLPRETVGMIVVMYAGNIGPAQGLDIVISAARILEDDNVAVSFVFLGSGLDENRLRRRVVDEGVRNVFFLGRQLPAMMASYYRSADALLVHLRDDPLFAISIPSKIQSYLLAGKPVLLGGRGDAANLLRRSKAGFVFDPDSSEGLALAVKQFVDLTTVERDRLGISGREFYHIYLSLEVGAEKYVDLMARVVMEKA